MKNLEFFIALRYIKKKKFQSIVSILAIFISLTIFITSIVISNGLKSNMINSILTINPHITVIKDFSENEYKDIMNEIEKIGVKSTNANVYMSGFVKYKDMEIIPSIQATDIEKLDLNLVLEDKDYKGLDYVYIGEEFSKEYGIYKGDKINLVSLNGREIILTVKAVFKTGFLAYDKNLVLVPLKIGQILQDRGDNVSNISVRIDNPENIKQLNIIKNKISKIDDSMLVYTWAEENSNLLSAINLENFILILLLSMLFIISSFVVNIVLSILVREKTRDIGILRAFGYSSKSIQKIFILQGSILGIIGILLSAIFSPIVLVFIQILFKKYIQQTYYIKGLPLVFDIKLIALIYLFAIIIILLFSYIPARKAAKLEPMEAIKFNL